MRQNENSLHFFSTFPVIEPGRCAVIIAARFSKNDRQEKADIVVLGA